MKFIFSSLALLSDENPNTEDFLTSRIFDEIRTTTEKPDTTVPSED
jgi:hypothetical protein